MHQHYGTISELPKVLKLLFELPLPAALNDHTDFFLSRQSRRIIKQNLVISLGMVAVLIPLTILGISGIGPAVVGHEGSTLVVVFNGLRLLVYQNSHK